MTGHPVKALQDYLATPYRRDYLASEVFLTDDGCPHSGADGVDFELPGILRNRQAEPVLSTWLRQTLRVSRWRDSTGPLA